MRSGSKSISRKRVVASYDQHYRQLGVLRESDAFYTWVLRKLGVQKNTKLLDVACGEGHLVRLAIQRGVDAIGVDFSNNAALTAHSQTKVISIVGDGQALPFLDATFDYVTNIGSLEHFFDPVEGLREMRRVLHHEGKIALLLPNSFYLVDIIWHVWRTGYSVSHKQMIERFATKNEWNDLIEGEGFRVLKTYKYNMAFPHTRADFEWYRTHLRKILYLLVAPFMPTNLSYSFLYIAKIASNAKG